ncbi:MAG: methionine--tRNA ligase [Candidatus Dormibacteria bacterium]
MPDPYYVTTAIDYVNGDPHIGHAYEKIAADALCRHKRMCGHETWLVVGSDEHSQSVAREAARAGLEPLAYCDSMVPRWREIFRRLQVDHQAFVRTSSPENRRTTEEFLSRVHANGHIYKGSYAGFFCAGCEQYYQERELVEGKCPEHKVALEWLEEENYFFRVSAFAEQLEQLHLRDDFLQPESRRKEMLNVIREGLQDVSISRGFTDWGFPLPFDQSQVIYVWFDALLSYVTGIGFATDEARFRHFWPCDVHVIGKGITRFHTVMWPAMLMAAGVELPRRVFSHGYVNIGGEKMSKSRGLFFEPLGLLDALQPPGEVSPWLGSDGARYGLLREIPFDRDGDFSLEVMVDRYNADLANDFGNLASRVLKMLAQYVDGRLGSRAGFEPAPELLAGRPRDLAAGVLEDVRDCMDRLDFSGALARTWQLVDAANRYVEGCRPWDLNRDGRRDELNFVLFEALETLRLVMYLAAPVIPDACERLAAQLGEPAPSTLGPGGPTLAEVAVWREQRGSWPWQTAAGEVLFPRLDKARVLAGEVTGAALG